MRGYILLMLTLVFSVIRSQDGEYCYSTDQQVYRWYSTKTGYLDSHAGTPGVDIGHNVPGCSATHAYLIARHGTRFISSRSIQLGYTYLTGIRNQILDSGSLCAEDRDALEAWVPRMNVSDTYKLSPSGWRELRGLAERYQQRFPDLLTTAYDTSRYDIRHTNVSTNGDRTKDSAKAFAQGLFGSEVGVTIVENEGPDWMLYYFRYCDKWLETVGNIPVIETQTFKDGPEMTSVNRDVTSRLRLPNDTFTNGDILFLHEYCRVEHTIYNDSPWCAMFSQEDLLTLEYVEDLDSYWKDGNANPLNYQIACYLLGDILRQLQDARDTEKNTVSLRFGHESTVNKLFTRLGFFSEDMDDLRADNFEEMADRVWRNSRNTPYMANIVFVLYSCQDDYLVKVFINEKLVTIPGCESNECSLDMVESLWQPMVDDCDMEQICKYPQDETTMGKYPPDETTMGKYPTDETTMGKYPTDETTMGKYPTDETTMGTETDEKTGNYSTSTPTNRPNTPPNLGSDCPSHIQVSALSVTCLCLIIWGALLDG